jgi:hypothetical protein
MTSVPIVAQRSLGYYCTSVVRCNYFETVCSNNGTRFPLLGNNDPGHESCLSRRKHRDRQTWRTLLREEQIIIILIIIIIHIHLVQLKLQQKMGCSYQTNLFKNSQVVKCFYIFKLYYNYRPTFPLQFVHNIRQNFKRGL